MEMVESEIDVWIVVPEDDLCEESSIDVVLDLSLDGDESLPMQENSSGLILVTKSNFQTSFGLDLEFTESEIDNITYASPIGENGIRWILDFSEMDEKIGRNQYCRRNDKNGHEALQLHRPGRNGWVH